MIAEVEDIVPVGELAPKTIHAPGRFVDYLVLARPETVRQPDRQAMKRHWTDSG